MSIASALGSALSGLTAASRAAEVVSSNVANAQTPGYGRREISLQARSIGGSGLGVSVIAINRRVDQVLIPEVTAVVYCTVRNVPPTGRT